MRFILGLIIFWISTFGYLMVFNKKTKLPLEILLPFIFTLIGIVMFCAGILNMMKIAVILVCLLGMICFGYTVLKREFEFKKIININWLILGMIILYFTFICSSMHLMHFDNFTHWGLLPKTMFFKNALPNFENTIITFKGYQPGSACFIYYFGALVGKTESSMIVAQNYLLIAYFFSLLVLTWEKRGKSRLKNYMLKAVIMVSYLFVILISVKFYDLLVDSLIAVMSIYSILLLYYFRDDLKKAFIYCLPVSVYLFLVKNVGIVLVGINCLGLLYLGIRNKCFKKSFGYSILTGIVSVLFFYIWSCHVSYVYGNMALYSTHSLSSANILSELGTKGWGKMLEFGRLYFKHFIDLRNNLPNIYIIAINLLFGLVLVIYKKMRVNTIKVLIGCDVIYLGYYLILGVMYILSMSWEEVIILAGFNRYMFTMIFIVMGVFVIYFVNLIMMEKKISKVSLGFSALLVVIGLGVILKSYVYNYKFLLGDQGYYDSLVYKYDKLLNDDKYNSSNNEFYYVYAPISSSNDSGFLYNLSKFKLNTDKCTIVRDLKQFDMEIDSELKKKIVIYDEDEDILDYVDDNGYKRVRGGLYSKEG